MVKDKNNEKKNEIKQSMKKEKEVKKQSIWLLAKPELLEKCVGNSFYSYLILARYLQSLLWYSVHIHLQRVIHFSQLSFWNMLVKYSSYKDVKKNAYVLN